MKNAAIAGLVIAVVVVGLLVMTSKKDSAPAAVGDKPNAVDNKTAAKDAPAGSVAPASAAATATEANTNAVPDKAKEPGYDPATDPALQPATVSPVTNVVANSEPDLDKQPYIDDPDAPSDTPNAEMAALVAKYGETDLTLYLMIQEETGKKPPAAVLELLDKKKDGKPLPELVAFATSKLGVDMKMKMKVVQWLEARDGIMRSGNEEMGDDERNIRQPPP